MQHDRTDEVRLFYQMFKITRAAESLGSYGGGARRPVTTQSTKQPPRPATLTNKESGRNRTAVPRIKQQVEKMKERGCL